MAGLAKYACRALIAVAAVTTAAVFPSAAFALTKYDLMGDYVISKGQNYYPAYGLTITENDVSGIYGRASVSGQALIYEFGAVYQGLSFARWGGGFYTFNGSQAFVSIRGFYSETITVQMPSANKVVVSGSSYDEYGDYYTYRYEYVKTNTYYETAQVQQQIADATADLYTQQQVNAAVAAATAGLYTQQQLDDAVNAATNGLYTQQQLDSAVSAATAGLYTQAELDAAVSEASSSVETKVVPIILLD